MTNLTITNLKITTEELQMLRSLPDFDLIMVLSDIDEHRWSVAKKTLRFAHAAVTKNEGKPTNGATE